MYYPQPYRPEETEEDEQEESLDLTLYDRIDSQWLALFEGSLVFCSLSISASAALLLRAFGFTPVVFGTLGIVAIIVGLLATINWRDINQRLKTRLALCLLAATVAVTIATADTVVDWIKVNPDTINRIVNVSALIGTVVIALVLLLLAGRVKNAR